MTYRELYKKAINNLDLGRITLGEFDEMVKPLNHEIRKTGHWIFKNDNIAIPTGYYQCSECEKGKSLNKDNFCPNCGAKMKGE